MITTIIFDIGEVITFSHFKEIYKNFALKTGASPEFITEYHMNNWDENLLGNIPLTQFWQDLGADSTIPTADLPKIWLEEALKIRELNIDLLDIIEKLRSHYKVGSLTNLTPSRKMVDEHQKIFSHFEFNVLSCDEHIKKPDPAFYKLGLERAGCSPAEALLVDDKERNTIAAENLGWHTIIFKNNTRLLTDLEQIGIKV